MYIYCDNKTVNYKQNFKNSLTFFDDFVYQIYVSITDYDINSTKSSAISGRWVRPYQSGNYDETENVMISLTQGPECFDVRGRTFHASSRIWRGPYPE